ncbi:hypothetical protein E5Q_01568, partial [Mixia osmundae IAM 14324]
MALLLDADEVWLTNSSISGGSIEQRSSAPDHPTADDSLPTYATAPSNPAGQGQASHSHRAVVHNPHAMPRASTSSNTGARSRGYYSAPDDAVNLADRTTSNIAVERALGIYRIKMLPSRSPPRTPIMPSRKRVASASPAVSPTIPAHQRTRSWLASLGNLTKFRGSSTQVSDHSQTRALGNTSPIWSALHSNSLITPTRSNTDPMLRAVNESIRSPDSVSNERGRSRAGSGHGFAQDVFTGHPNSPAFDTGSASDSANPKLAHSRERMPGTYQYPSAASSLAHDEIEPPKTREPACFTNLDDATLLNITH